MAVYLGDIGRPDGDVKDALTEALEDKSLSVRTAASNALRKIDHEASAKAGVN
jgi:HEAT repeat protein